MVLEFSPTTLGAAKSSVPKSAVKRKSKSILCQGVSKETTPPDVLRQNEGLTQREKPRLQCEGTPERTAGSCPRANSPDRGQKVKGPRAGVGGPSGGAPS